MAVMIGQIAVEKVVVIPSNDTRVGANTAEASSNVARGNGVKRTTDIQEGSETMGPRIDMSFDIIGEGRGSSLRQFVTAKSVLRVKRPEPDTLLHLPGTQAFQSLEEVIGKGYGAVGRGLGI